MSSAEIFVESGDRMTESVLAGSANEFAQAYKDSRAGFQITENGAFVLLSIGRGEFAQYDLVYDLASEVFKRSDCFSTRIDLWRERLRNDDDSFQANQSEQTASEACSDPNQWLDSTMRHFAIDVAVRLGNLIGLGERSA